MCQVLKNEEYKRKVLERTPMRRVGKTHEISGTHSKPARNQHGPPDNAAACGRQLLALLTLMALTQQ